jgi:dTDP-4-amino-4,6-dideoxygalactose transaminase
MAIPLVDLKAQYSGIAGEVQNAIQRVCASCAFVLGPDVKAFEDEFARFCGVDHAIGVGSGTDAIHLACRALRIGPGDEVITCANTFVATLIGVQLAGARPVLVDCREEDFLIDPDRVEAAITGKTRAIMPVHLYGQCADMDRLLEIASKHDLAVIEDAAQAHGADYKGRRAGSMGDIGCFSFYPGKNLGAYGDGGCCVTRRRDLHEALHHLRNWGSTRKYHHDTFGMNSRLDTVQAAVLRIKLPHLADWNQARLDHARRYGELLSNQKDIVTPRIPGRGTHVFHLYVIRVPERDRVLAHLHENGIEAGIHYPIPPHLSDACKELGYSRGAFPITEKLCQEILSLPMYAELTEDQARYVINRLTAARPTP